MQRAKEPAVQHIPFVAGKSLNKSHNIGVRIQQTKSLITNSNKKIKPKKSQLSPSHEHMCHKGHSMMTTTSHRRNSDTCPVLKYCDQMKRFSMNDSGDEWNERPKEKQHSIEEVWGKYMFDVESKNIVPVKCTCFSLETKKMESTESKNLSELNKKASRLKDRAAIYSEARKVMNDCRVALNSSDEEIADDLSAVEDFNKKPTRSTKMARYMHQIKQFQDRLSK